MANISQCITGILFKFEIVPSTPFEPIQDYRKIGYRILGFLVHRQVLGLQVHHTQVLLRHSENAYKDSLCSMAHPSNFIFHGTKQALPAQCEVQRSKGRTRCNSRLAQGHCHGCHIILTTSFTLGATQESLCFMVHPSQGWRM